MIALLKYLGGPWEIARGYLRTDLEHIETALNQRWGDTFGDNNVLGMDSGGLGVALTPALGAIVYSTATKLALLAPVTTAGKVLQSGASAAPTWSTPTYPSASGTSGKLIRADGTNNVYTTFTIPTTFATGSFPYGSSTDTLTALAISFVVGPAMIRKLTA